MSSHWSQVSENQIIEKVGLHKIKNLVALMAKMGYIGPIGFDAMLNQGGEYEFIYDSNPRLSAIMSIMSVREFLEKQDIKVQSLSSLGYRGRYKISQSNIKILAKQKVLLEKTNTDSKDTKGVLLMPNLAGGTDSYTHSVNNSNFYYLRNYIIFFQNFLLDYQCF